MTKRNSTGASASKQAKKHSTKRLTTEIFIERAKAVHGSTYCYDLVVYKNTKSKVDISCAIHGVFSQFAGDHMAGSGCPNCANKLKQSEVIKRFIGIHGNAFDYSKVKYLSSTDKILISCLECANDFWTTPDTHFKGAGCPHCSLEKRWGGYNTKRFIDRARLVHGDTYNYDLVEYKNNSTKLKILCELHGIFKQPASRHLQGSGCPQCGLESKSMTKAEFIPAAKLVHGDLYDYTNTVCTKDGEKVEIYCKRCDDYFSQVLSSHLNGNGCRKCYWRSKRITQSEFISRCIKRHGNAYCYADTKYISADKVVDIKCNTCDLKFKQIAIIHSNGSGCPECAKTLKGRSRSDFEKSCARNNNGNGFLYVLKCQKDNELFYKIGITSKSIRGRFGSYNSLPYEYDVLFMIGGSAAYIYNLEKSLHRNLSKMRYNPNLDFDGMTECFSAISPVKKLLQKLDSTDQLQLLA